MLIELTAEQVSEGYIEKSGIYVIKKRFNIIKKTERDTYISEYPIVQNDIKQIDISVEHQWRLKNLNKKQSLWKRLRLFLVR